MWNGMVGKAWDSWIRKARLRSLMLLHSTLDPPFACVFTSRPTAVKSTFERRAERIIGLRFILPWFVYSFIEDVLDGRFKNRGGHRDQHKLDTKMWRCVVCSDSTRGREQCVWQTPHLCPGQQLTSSLQEYGHTWVQEQVQRHFPQFLFCRTGIAVIWLTCLG